MPNSIQGNQEIKLSKKVLIAIYSAWTLVIIAGAIFFTKQYFKIQKETERFIEEKVIHKIIKIDDLRRGAISLVLLSNGNKQIKTTGLPIAYEIKKFDIQEGDSVFKNAKSAPIITSR